MASFSNAAFGQDTAFASTAWDFGGGPPPPPPPAPTTGGTVGSGRTREDERRPFDDVPLIVALERLPDLEPAPVARQIVAKAPPPADDGARLAALAAAEAAELQLLQMQAGVALTELQIAAWREARRQALEEEEGIAVMLMAIALQ